MNRKNSSMARSSAAGYLSFVAAGGNGGVDNYLLKKVFADSELEEVPVIRKFRITEVDEKLSPLVGEFHPIDTNYNYPIRNLSRPNCTNF